MSARPDPPPFQSLSDLVGPEGPSGRPSRAVQVRRALAARHFSRPGVVRTVALTVLSAGLVGAGVVAAARSDLQASSAPQPVLVDSTAVEAPEPGEAYTFADLDIHPDRLFGTYFAGAFTGADADAGVGADFRWRLDMYRKAYGVDDNFTIRVLDDRTGQTLQTVTLQAARDRFRGGGQAEWDAVNRERTATTTGLRNKWLAYGIPEDKLVIRWGYRDQTMEARDRDARYVHYEVNLARRLGLSVLATEIGTVETFNQDALVSSAGARSRYQMMPDVLRRFNVEQYTLSTASGATVQVKEELHPLLAMEPSLMFVRAYANAVGHELPGISAYHTGPGNLFALYREYLRAFPGLTRAQGKHVSDAYMWGVTDGFARVDAVSSFGTQSRVYVLKAYGALRATETLVIDPEETARGELVRLRPGATATLDQLLTALAPHTERIDWGPARGASMYEKFRDLNPHLNLPLGLSGVPAGGNVRFTSRAGAVPVRFFLPVGSTDVLRRVGLDVVGSTQTFDQSTYLVPESERTATDREYAALVEDTGRFGFTRANKARLDAIVLRLHSLAQQNPESRYRQTQAEIAGIHRGVWRTRGFDDLVATTETLFSTDPRVRASREPVASAAPAPAPPARTNDTIVPLPPRPPRTDFVAP
ncbi:MAG TPA: hypothetical protein VF576_05765 [Rubricoccaceae bacterium]